LCQYHAVFIVMSPSIVWSRVLWCLQHCSFCSELLWLFEVFCVSTCISWSIFLFICRMSLEFW
jgi:hypothetical protein